MPVAKGYKQSPEHIARRSRFGDEHHAWKGDTVGTNAGRDRARRLYALADCERCGKPGTDRHHRDGNTANNEPTNIGVLCRRCHMAEDGRLEASRLQAAAIAGAAAEKKARTHCKRGHEYTTQNTRMVNGWRVCRACVQIQKAHRGRKAAAK